MRVIVRLTDIVHGIDVSEHVVTLEPMALPSIVQLSVGGAPSPGSEGYLVLKGTIQATLPG